MFLTTYSPFATSILVAGTVRVDVSNAKVSVPPRWLVALCASPAFEDKSEGRTGRVPE